jgi:hypothetical protein
MRTVEKRFHQKPKSFRSLKRDDLYEPSMLCVYVCMCVYKLDVHESVHRDTTIKIIKKMHYID